MVDPIEEKFFSLQTRSTLESKIKRSSRDSNFDSSYTSISHSGKRVVPRRRKVFKTRLDGRRDLSFRRPQLLEDIVPRTINKQQWTKKIAVYKLNNYWDRIVGEEVSRHTRIQFFDEKKKILHIQCDSTPWSTQLRYIQKELLRKIALEIGSDIVTEVKIYSPAVPQWRKGKYGVKGRGPRDTYG